MNSPWPAPLLSVDSPSGPVAGPTLHFAGWVGSHSPIENIAANVGPGFPAPKMTRVDRPDVRRAYPDVPHIEGFAVNLPRESLIDDAVGVSFFTCGRTCRYARPLTPGVSTAVKKEKLDRIAPLLRADATHGRCEMYFDCLTPALRTSSGIASGDRVSSNAYDCFALGLFSLLHDGLILDAGAGFNADYRPNVVNLEIVPYPTTDVLAVGECLPFADDSFDAVLSLAVLEHVRDPFACAAEIRRVLKPGGLLCAVVPFLQPYHAYPHHYYNMTHQGLANLFTGLEVIDQRVPLSGLPVWSLTWFLRSYCDGLPASEQEAFRRMPIGELIEQPAALLNRRFVQELSPDANFTLASTTMLLARK